MCRCPNHTPNNNPRPNPTQKANESPHQTPNMNPEVSGGRHSGGLSFRRVVIPEGRHSGGSSFRIKSRHNGYVPDVFWRNKPSCLFWKNSVGGVRDAGEDMRDPSRNKVAINGKTVCHWWRRKLPQIARRPPTERQQTLHVGKIALDAPFRWQITLSGLGGKPPVSHRRKFLWNCSRKIKNKFQGEIFQRNYDIADFVFPPSVWVALGEQRFHKGLKKILKFSRNFPEIFSKIFNSKLKFYFSWKITVLLRSLLVCVWIVHARACSVVSGKGFGGT